MNNNFDEGVNISPIWERESERGRKREREREKGSMVR